MRGVVLAALVAAFVGIASGCGPDPSGSPTRVAHPTHLAGGSWRLVALNGRAPAAGPDVTLDFTGDRVGGTAPCNAFGGGYTYDPGSGAFHVTQLISTKRACAVGPGNELEAAYFDGLRTATEADMDPDGRLVLVTPGGSMVFEVAGQPVLASPPAREPSPS